LRKINCVYCNSNQVIPGKEKEEFLKLARKKKRSPEAELLSSLVAEHGTRALVALRTFGVGAQTAARILSRQRSKEDTFYWDLLDAQKTFVRTRKYWSA
jgi:ATP-dependent Lhr-like helicase